ncbi:MAG: conserved rane protein of unknown function [Frankiales bacterium]|nr:conserved rane protein of unknown function [Frankiales bacterium]MCW2706378.1 conserved rane protein of unknown function [Frankiales bacterium]
MTEQTQGKGRPTPKRNQKARGPVAPPPTNRRAAAKQLRAKQAEQRRAVRDGSRAGDERMFLARDRGPVRSYVRDAVDSQRTLGPFLLPYMVIVILLGFVNNPQLYAAAFLSMLGVIVIVAIDFIRIGRVISRGVKERFPDQKRRPHVIYGIQRTTLIRRWRTPPAKVSVGADV